MKTLTLVYADGTRFIVGSFPDDASIDAWLTAEKEKIGWKADTTVEIETAPPSTDPANQPAT